MECQLLADACFSRAQFYTLAQSHTGSATHMGCIKRLLWQGSWTRQTQGSVWTSLLVSDLLTYGRLFHLCHSECILVGGKLKKKDIIVIKSTSFNSTLAKPVKLVTLSGESN